MFYKLQIFNAINDLSFFNSHEIDQSVCVCVSGKIIVEIENH